MRRRAPWIVGVLAVLVGGWLAVLSSGRDGHADARPDPAQIGGFGHGAWCWFADPRAVHVGGANGKTFVGWIAWDGAITVGAYGPVPATIRTHVIGYWIHDDHASPSFLVEPDKRLTVFWSGHNGHTMNYRTTLRPEDISAWGPIEHVRSKLPGNLGFTYPNPVLLPSEGNKLYVFWRGSDWDADYATRTAAGQWSAAHELITLPGQRPYVKVAGNGSDAIALAYTDGNPGGLLTSVYYAVYRRGWLWSAGGRRIARMGGRPIAPSRGDLVYNGRATRVASWVWDVALDSHQRPVIVYATFPSVNNDAYWYARWNGRRWVSHFLTFGGPSISPGTIETNYAGGIALDHSDPSIVYLSRKVGRWFRIERWRTADGGSRWRRTIVVRTGADAVRPVVPRGGGPLSLVWMSGHYGRYIHYRTSISFLADLR